LSRHYRLFLFSNTNIIHYQHFAFRVPRVGDIAKLFHYTYYSHQIGLAKPHISSFEHVLAHGKMQANETLFLDDLPENVEGAKAVGMKTMRVEYPNQWLGWL
jgi:glucose-1-phosphatase